MAAMIESFSARESVANRLLVVAIALGAFVVGILAWRRYSRLLVQAEQLGECATCSACGTYGRFAVIGSGPRVAGAGAGATGWMRVRCRKCEAEWQIG